MNDKQQIEKSLKRFLKKKLAYTTALLVTFLITGNLAASSGATAAPFGEGGPGVVESAVLQEELLAKIAVQKAEIEGLLAENEARLKELDTYYMDLVNEADWYSKPWYPSYLGMLPFSWRDGSKGGKDWNYGIRTDTAMDGKRETFNAALYGAGEETALQAAIDHTGSRRKGSSGWISASEAYNDNTHTYDYEDMLMILPVVKAPEIERPAAPAVAFTVPSAPMAVSVASPQVVNISVGAINVSAPSVSAPTAPVLPTVTAPTLSVITVNEPNVTINPITINVNPATPSFTINPVVPTITMNVRTPETVVEPSPTDPSRDINPVNPDANPFSDFSWGWMSGGSAVANTNSASNNELSLGDNINVSGGIFWSGVAPVNPASPEAGQFTNTAAANTAGLYNPSQTAWNGTTAGSFVSRTFDRRHLSIINSYNGRWTGVVGNSITGGTFHVKGGNAVSASYPQRGTEAFHLVADVNLQNVTAYLYGEAAFINAEAFRGGQTTMSNVTVHVVGDHNTIFNLRGSSPAQDNGVTSPIFSGGQFSTRFGGNANITVETQQNSVYAARNYAGGLRIDNTGDIVLNGASNIGFSFLTWVPDKSKYIANQYPSYASGGSSGEGSLAAYIPYVKLTAAHPMKLNGDENVGIFFNQKISGYDVGIHQGYFELYFDIGTAAPGANGDLTKSGYTVGVTDGSIGVYAINGQRQWVDEDGLSTLAHFDLDPIHDLRFDVFKIAFGNKSKNGFMFLAKNGTVIDIQTGTQASFSDGINGASTTEANASENTIIAYAKGKWSSAAVTANGEGGTGLTAKSGHTLEGLPTEIKVGQSLDMVSKKGIAFFADANGLITVSKNATGWGKESVMAYAQSNGVVNVAAGVLIKAVDGTVSAAADKYKNLGAYAGANGTVTINGNVEINGIGAFAKGSSAKVYLNGSNNIIRTGISGGLDAMNGGYIEFAGGTIEHKNITGLTDSHKGKLPFYADTLGSHINFTGAGVTTTLEIWNGVAFYGASSDYAAASGTSTRYNGMSHVQIKLMDNGVNLGVFEGLNINWTGATPTAAETGYLSQISAIPKVNNIDPNGKWYNSYLEGGTFTIGRDVNLDQASSGATKGADPFNDITLEREKVTIASGVTVASTAGHGLALGSNVKANSAGKNTDSGYENNGTVNISGNNTVGLFTSYGYIDNKGAIIVDKGIAAVGVNGSKITNTGTITAGTAATTGAVGVAGLTRKLNSMGVPEASPETYGVEAGDTTTKYIEIDNQGTITVNGTGGVAIYADNNTGAAGTRNRVSVSNNKLLTLGNSGVGVMVKGTNDGGTVTLTDGGGQGIVTGTNGIGVYAENSTVTLNGSPYTIEVKDNGIGVLVEKNSTLNVGSLKLNYTGATAASATALVYKGAAGTTTTNNVNIEVVTPAAMTGSVSGIYAYNGGTLKNYGNITATTEGAYGIIAEGTDAENSGLITTGQSAGNGGVAIFAKDGAVATAGDKLVIEGKNAVGIYALNDALTADKTISATQGAGNLEVKGKSAVGIYVKDKTASSHEILQNASIIDLTPSTAATDMRIGIFLENAKHASNRNTGDINVSGSASDGNNIGIYSLESALTNSGNITVTGVKNIGIALETSTGTDLLTLANGVLIDVTTATMADADLNIGVYGAGNGITITATGTNPGITARANTVGVYLDGDNTSTLTGNMDFTLYSDAGGKIGIGVYLKDGARYGAGIWHGKSAGTASDGAGNPIRPIGLYYGTNSTGNTAKIEIDSASQDMIGMYGKSLSAFANSGGIDVAAKSIGAYFQDTNLTNTGNVNVSGANGYGVYLKGGQSTTSGSTAVSTMNAIGWALTGAGATLTNSGAMTVTGTDAIGVYSEDGAEFTNTGGITAGASSMGGFTSGGTLENSGTLTSSKVGFYAENGGAAIQSGGTLDVLAGIGILATGTDAGGTPTKAELTGGLLTTSGAGTGLVGVYADGGAEITLDGTTISLGTSGNAGLYLLNAVGVLKSGNIGVGASGTAVYGKNSAIDISAYTGVLTPGNKGIAFYSEDNTITGTALKVGYLSGTNDKGVGIYYKGTTPVTNAVAVQHQAGGDNLVLLYADGVDVTNTANQTVLEKGIGFFLDNGSTSANQATIDLDGAGAVGIYLDKTVAAAAIPVLTDLGTITGSAALTAGNSKVGVYVKNGDITGTSVYNFAVDGGVALYLENSTVSYSGRINLSANSTAGNRAIGIYVSPTITGNIVNDMTVSGSDAIGMYLATSGGSGPAVTYDGDLEITSTGSTLANRGVGVVLDTGASFTLGTLGKIGIGGANNIGFYVKNGASLNVAGGTVTNTVDGVFAYIENGTLNFTAGSPININYANIIVSGPSGSITNATAINVGTRGLQAGNYATIHNTSVGSINATVDEAKALVGTTNATITNDGAIILTGDKSVGIYTESGAVATSAGNVTVGDKSVAYYAGKDSLNVGGVINITGTASVGTDGTVLYGGGGVINYNGADIVLADQTTALTLADSGSSVDFNGHEITTGEKGVGVFVKDTGDFSDILNLSKITVGKDSAGIYLDNAVAFNETLPIAIAGTNGIGILTTKNGNITYGGALTSTIAGAKGILSTGTGTLTNQGNIALTGNSSIGVYGENSAAVINDTGATVQVGAGTTAQAAVALYGKNVGAVTNDGTVILGQQAVGMYGKNATVINNGVIQNAGGHNTGIYADGGSAANSGTITLGDTSNGVYVENGTGLTNTGNITLGNTKSAGLYGAGTTPVSHAGGTIAVGKDSVGVASEAGTLTVAAAAVIQAGAGSTYIYTESGTGDNYSNLNLSDYSVGLYTKSGTLTNYADITTGNSAITATEQKISVGMATGTTDALGNPVGGGTIVNQGNIYVTTDHSVGMIASNPTGSAANYGLIDVTGKEAYGIQGSNEAVITNYGTVKATGDKSRGLAGTGKALVVNAAGGRIEVTGTGAEGVYVGQGAEVQNHGVIYVNGVDALGIHFGQGSDAGKLVNTGTITVVNGKASQDDGSTDVNVGSIKIEDTGPTITVGNVVYDAPTLINGGMIEYVNGTLDFGTIKIASTEGNIGTISATSFANGEFIVLPNATQGNNDPVHVIQYLKGAVNLPNNGTVRAISHSVTWLADLQTDKNDPNLARIVLVKIPYTELTAGTAAIELGKGLDEIYTPAVDTELQMFDAIDMISDKDELAETFDMELRGNIYANIQHRMEDVREIFEMAVDQLSQDRIYSKESLKVGLIGNGGKYTDRNPSIEDYDYKTTGFMLLKEYDHRTYGRKSSWNLGFAYTGFDFDYGSKEKVYSVQAGVGYEDFIGDSKRLKYHGRLEVTANRHNADRKIHLSNGIWSNEGKYWSYEAVWKNKLRYAFPVSTRGNVKAGVYGTLDLGYGRFEGFKESGDGIRLDIKGQDMLMIRPGVGADVTFTKYTKRGKFSLIGNVAAQYELGDYYDGPNKAKIRDTSAGYYDLEQPKDLAGIFKAGVQLKYETKSGHGVGFEVVREEGSRKNTRYGVNFTYRFDQ